MFKIIFTLFFLLFSTFAHADFDYTTRSWLTLNYTDTTDNKLPEQYSSIEAGLQFNLDISDHLNWNSLFVYESAYDDEKYFDYNYSYVDFYFNEKNYGGGYKIGRVPMTFGFWSDTKFSPDRPFVLQYYPLNMVWEYNRKLFTSIDGHSFSFYVHDLPFCLELEYNFGIREDLKPEMDYVQQFEFIEPESQEVHYGFQLDLIYKSLRYRFIENDMSTNFNISPKHYASLPFPVSYNREGTHSINYLYQYNGIEYYWNDFSLTLERIDFHYTGKGSANQYFENVWNTSLPKATNQLYHGMLRYYQPEYELWLNYGSDDLQTGSDRYQGTGFSIHHMKRIILKGQVTQVHGIQWLTWNENKNKPPLISQSKPEKDWRIYAVSITYLF